MKENKKTSTIFKQLILNIIVPVVCALVILTLLNQYRVKTTAHQNNKIQNQLITDQIELSLIHQDFGLDAIESRIEDNLFIQSHHLVNQYFLNTDSIEVVNLSHIRDSLNMYSREQDIYIINREGIIVNTTFEKDKNFNLFSIGEKFQSYIEGVFEGKEYVSEKFSIELKTGKIRKYTYQPTLDGKYLIQTGTYSLEADRLVTKTKETLSNISIKYKNIKKIDLFIDADTPFSIITSNKQVKDPAFLKDIFTSLDTNLSKRINYKEKGRYIEKEYIPMKRENTTLYKKALIEIVADRTDINNNQRNDVIQNIAISLFTILLVIFLIYQKTKVITSPIKKLLDNVNRITKGDLSERAEVEGNNEITQLSEKFNSMLERLQTSYSNLEQKVKERTADLNTKKEELEIQKKNIEDSIRYAQRIQNAIIPSTEEIQKDISKTFMFYKPKDVVSGDFPYYYKKGDYLYYAAVDCTGHGVPGAMMSLIGHLLLNDILNDDVILSPSEVLDKLHWRVVKTLKQDDEDNKAADGMDIAMCRINLKENKLEYSGAHRPLYHIRNDELTQYKGGRYPVGGNQYKGKNTYENFSLNIEKGDSILFFSDGFPDQFGGPEQLKYGPKRIRTAFLENVNKSPQELEEYFDKSYHDWMGNTKQIDDVLLIGIKF